MEREILPWLRRQEGFMDLIILAVPDDAEVATISFWDRQGNADAYSASGYPQVLGILASLLDAPPYVKTFDVVGSTFHGATLGQRLEQENLLRENDSEERGYRSYENSV